MLCKSNHALLINCYSMYCNSSHMSKQRLITKDTYKFSFILQYFSDTFKSRNSYYNIIERLHLRHNHDVKQPPCGKMYTLCNGISSTFCYSSAVCYFSDTNYIRVIVRWLEKTIVKDNQKSKSDQQEMVLHFMKTVKSNLKLIVRYNV